MASFNLDGAVTNNATLRDVEAAIHTLDGVETTLLIVELPSGQTLTIGGGPDRFVAEITENDDHRWAVVEPGAGSESVDLVVGGQLVDYPGRLCVTLQAVLDAARTFLEQGGARSPRLVWSVET